MDLSKDELKRLVKSKIATIKRLSNQNRKKRSKKIEKFSLKLISKRKSNKMKMMIKYLILKINSMIMNVSLNAFLLKNI